MTWDPVPWFVAGAKHSPEVARLLAYMAGGGSEGGVVGSGDAKVLELDVPGTAVRVMPGAIVVPNRQPGAAYETYLARNPDAEEVPMTAVGSGAARTDLIIARIEDPEMPGVPADPDGLGPYVFTRVIEDVPATTNRVQEIAGHENDSAITLARVTRPASTGTVVAAHITSLRELATPRAKHEVRIFNPPEADLQDTVAVGGEVWPDGGAWSIVVPPWATSVRVIATWAQIKVPPGDAQGWLWAKFVLGGTVAATQQVRYDTPSDANQSRETYVCADEIPVPAAMRGKTVTLSLLATKTGGVAAARITADSGSACSVTVDFLETAG